jgi:hypothetical protein
MEAALKVRKLIYTCTLIVVGAFAVSALAQQSVYPKKPQTSKEATVVGLLVALRAMRRTASTSETGSLRGSHRMNG